MVSCVACGITHKQRKNGVTFHRFPNDPHRRQHWLKFVNREDYEVAKYAVLCSQHFNDQEFDRSATKVLLSNKAIPTKKAGLRHKYFRSSCVARATKKNVQSDELAEYLKTPFVPLPTTTTTTTTTTTVKQEPEITIDENTVAGSSKVKQETTDDQQQDTPEVKALKERVSNLTFALLQKSKIILNLRERIWKQQKQITRLQEEHVIVADYDRDRVYFD